MGDLNERTLKVKVRHFVLYFNMWHTTIMYLCNLEAFCTTAAAKTARGVNERTVKRTGNGEGATVDRQTCQTKLIYRNLFL